MDIYYKLPNNLEANLLITDITGRAISTYVLKEQESILHINDKNLKSGIYFYCIKQNNTLVKQAKFVIIK